MNGFLTSTQCAHQIYNADEEFEMEMKSLAEERKLVHSSYCDKCGVDCSEPYGDWAEDDHIVFVKVRNTFVDRQHLLCNIFFPIILCVARK